MRQPGAEDLALGDVLVRHDPAAVGPGLDRGGDDPAIRQPVGDMAHVLAGRALLHFARDLVGILADVETFRHAQHHDLAQGGAWPDAGGIDSVKLRVAVVGDDHAGLGVEHREALDHVLQGGIEQQVLMPELVVGGLELGQRAIERA